MMRISTASTFSTGVSTLQQRQREMSEAQQRLTSGKRVDKPSDDPTAAARAERAMAAMARADANQRALQASRGAMTLSESAMGDAGELLQQAREQVMAAGNAGFDLTQRLAITQALKGIRSQLLQIANRGDGAGGFIFGAQNSVLPPFVDNGSGVVASAPSQVRLAAADEPMPLNTNGEAVWLQADSGNGAFEALAVTPNGGAWVDGGRAAQRTPITSTYDLRFSVSAGVTTYEVFQDGGTTPVNSGPYRAGTAIQLGVGSGLSISVSGKPKDGETFQAVPSQASLSVFDAIDKAVAGLELDGATDNQVIQSVQFALRDLDSVSANMNTQRAAAGSWLNRLDSIEGRIAGQKLLQQTDRSDAEDLDMVQAVSDFSNKQASYDAALKTYASVQKLSLFQYVNT